MVFYLRNSGRRCLLLDDLDGTLGTVPFGAARLCLEVGGDIARDQHRRVADFVATEDFRRGNRAHLVALTTILDYAYFHAPDPSAAPSTLFHNSSRAGFVSERLVDASR